MRIRLIAATAALLASCANNTKVTALDRLHPCKTDEGPTDAYCGKLDVFEDRAAKSGRKIALNVAVLPALSNKGKPDPVFFLAGGPGQGATKLAKQIKELFRRVQADRDIVLVDQRGTGKSNGLECKMDADSLKEMEQQSDTAYIDKLRECLGKFQADTRLYTTNIAMDDLDDVRAWLGYGKINLFGGSYGTRAALVYLRRHEANTRAVVIDGVAPTDMRLPLYMARDSQRALDRLMSDCEADSACKSRFAGIRSKFTALVDRLQRQPHKVTVVHPRTGEREPITIKAPLVTGVVFTALYSTSSSALLPMLIDRASEGDYQALLAMAFAGEGMDISAGMHFSVVCSEDSPRIQPGDPERLLAGAFLSKEVVTYRLKPCEFWPRGAVDASYYEPVVSEVPTLVLSGDLDPVTPPSWGESVAKHLKRSRHLVVPGTGHGTAGRGCVIKMVQQFYNEADASKLDPKCLADMRRAPFFTTAAGPEVGK
jgi:pimeloyl-ACP methyl ester carboxylesterase